MSAFTGEIRNWEVVANLHGCYVVGEIQRDQKGRFSDGQRFHTSQVVSVTDTGPELHVVTMNSVFLLRKDTPKFLYQTSFKLEEEIAMLFDAAERWKKAHSETTKSPSIAFKKAAF